MSGITSCNINEINYPVRGSDDQGFQFDDVLEVPGALKVIVQDVSGTASFERGDKIELVDSVEGVVYSGTILASKPLRASPDINNPYTEHTVQCIDRTYPLTKLPNTQNYENWYGGDIAVDMVVNGALSGEGITVAAGLHRDSTAADFNTGILNGVSGYTTTGDGALELLKAGSDITIKEDLDADWLTGTLVNVTTVNSALMPTTQSALKFSAVYPIATGAFGYLWIKFWSGTQVVGSNDDLIFDVWIPDSAPYKAGGIVPVFSDNSIPGGLLDQNGLPNDGDTDLSNYAVNKWYTRTVSLSAHAGKTIIGMLAQVESTQTGSYTWYIKNAYLSSHSGSKIFAPTDTAPVVNPPIVYGYSQFVPLSASASVVTVCDLANSYRISPAYNIDPVKLLKGSNIIWYGTNTSVAASYDGIAFQPCTNNAALPALPVGSNLTGLTLTLKETFTLDGNDPTVIPLLQLLTASLFSAPNATKSDVVKAFETQAQWNTGTHSGTVATASGDLTIGSTSRNWNDGSTANQQFIFFALDQGSGPQPQAFQSVTSGAYQIALNADSSNFNFYGMSRFDFAGSVLDFTIECDLYFTPAGQSGGQDWVQAGVFYRTDPNAIYDGSIAGTQNSFAYLVTMGAGHIELGYGSNSHSDSYKQLQTVSRSFSVGSFVHVKIVVNGNRHMVYVANETTPVINVVDSTYTGPGSVGFRGWSGWTSAATTRIDNFVITPATSGTWTGPGTPIGSLGTCDASVISWEEVNTDGSTISFAQVQTSIDDGSTYQPCTNGGPIPNLPAGTNVSGKSIITKIFFQTISQPNAPIVRGLVWRVLAPYPGSSGTRSTAPIGIDYIDRVDQSGWGTASDGQTWAPVGTATAAVASGKLTIANTTGDFFERLGSRTDDDMDVTVPFMLSSSAITAGMTLRYVDANNHYKLQASTTSIDIVKKVAGDAYTLVSAPSTLVINTLYYMRFRVVDQLPVLLSGRIWQAGTLEDQENWTVMTSD